MKKTKMVVGLDVGANSIGWAVVEKNKETESGSIIGIGSRIIPMDQAEISDFNQGNLQSAAENRTHHRGVRRLRSRQLQRRERLVTVLKTIGFIDEAWEPNFKYSLAFDEDENTGKSKFKFQQSYQEMVDLFKEKHPDIKTVSHDWCIYYLRQKALQEKIAKEELAWIILQFNVKRGYYQLRNDDTLTTESSKFFVNSIVDEIIDLEDDVRGKKNLIIKLRNGISGQYTAVEIPNWIGKSIEFIVTEKKVKDGIKVSLSNPDGEDWTLRKKKTEQHIEDSGKTVGQYMFELLLNNPDVKIRGKEVHTIDRKFYKNELTRILDKQAEYHTELNDSELLKQSVNQLYKRNEAHKKNLNSLGMRHLIINDIIYYQRPLKSKKHLISNCKYESYCFNNKDGSLTKKPIKCIPKSHPLYQEFRIWQYIHNIKIFKKEEINDQGIILKDVEQTDDILNYTTKTALFDEFNIKKELSHSQILKAVNCNNKDYRINYEEGTKLKGNTFNYHVHKCLSPVMDKQDLAEFMTDQHKMDKLWHVVYSLGDREETLKSGLSQDSLSLNEEQVTALLQMPTLKKEYGAVSKKATKKLLPLMRCGEYWSPADIHSTTQKRIEHLIHAEESIEINDRTRDNLEDLHDISDFQGLNLAQASYVVYGFHSEGKDKKIYTTYHDVKIDELVPNHSLRNPTAEKIIRETLLVVRDIWKKYGKMDAIHVEMARELKLPNDKRRDYTNRRNENHLKNLRAKAMLLELSQDNADINPYSKGHQETFKIFEEGAVRNEKNIDKQIQAIRRKEDPSKSELNRYKLWLEQKYVSPYTGKTIQLSKLFTSDYEIEHIIPKALFYDDSFNNKIICETKANRFKDNRTAYQMICEDGGKDVGDCIKLLTKEEYEDRVKQMFASINYKKYKKLLSYDPPKSFASRQLNTTRYINRKLIELLDPFVRDEKDQDAKSRHILSIQGGVTSDLRGDWGLHHVWKKLLAPRFQRMNDKTESQEFYNFTNNRIDLSGYENELKRLDHRHHAVDALVIATLNSNHINYKNALHSGKKNKALENKLLQKDSLGNLSFKHPWPGFVREAEEKLKHIVISFKNKHKIVSKTNNFYQKYVEQADGTWKKVYVRQDAHPDHIAIRKPLHQETIYGKVTLKEYSKLSFNKALEIPDRIANRQIRKKVLKAYEAVNRDTTALKKHFKKFPLTHEAKSIDKVDVIKYADFATSQVELSDKIKESQISKIVDPQLKSDILAHLDQYDNNIAEAFGVNGLLEFNAKRAQPVKKVTVKQDLGIAFPLGEDYPKNTKYAKGAKGTNLFFIIYRNLKTVEHLINSDSTISFNDAIQIKKNNLEFGEHKEGYDYFILSPGDLVYVFHEDEEKVLPNELDYARIYKCVSFSKQQCFFIPHYVSAPIVNKLEYTALNKMERSIEGVMIKNNCLKLKVNRLGEIIGSE